LRTQIVARGQTIEGQLEHRIAAQRVGVVAILIASDNHQHAKADDLRQAMHNLFRHPRVLQAGREAVGNTQPAFDFAQGQQPAFRRQPAAVKTGDDRLALHW